MNTKVKCPTCSKSINWTPEARWRPFCSQRCKMLDLGDWFNESNAIAEQPAGVQPRNDDDF
jgi:hypothetical protein